MLSRLASLLALAGVVYSMTGGNPYFSLLAALYFSGGGDSPVLLNMTASACAETATLLAQALY